jgi:pimeloyl-ACP methyl ester carboxylesterase
MNVPVLLRYTELGRGEPLVILHGLFGSARNWQNIARHLSEQYRVIALDLRNHGQSPHAAAHDYPAMAADIEYLLGALKLRAVTLLGHSMGVKAAMHYALQRPERVHALVVVDIAPVTYPFRYTRLLAALREVASANITSRAEADTRLAAQDIESPLRAFLLQNLILKEGRYQWRFNLDAIERDMQHIMGFPVVPHTPAPQPPALFICGGRSEFVTPAHHADIRHLFPNARIVTLPQSSHWLHVEQPDRFMEIVTGFLQALPNDSSGSV